MELEDYDLSKLIPCRKIAFDNATDTKITLYNNKFHDLFAFYKNNWHYIATIKL